MTMAYKVVRNFTFEALNNKSHKKYEGLVLFCCVASYCFKAQTENNAATTLAISLKATLITCYQIKILERIRKTFF